MSHIYLGMSELFSLSVIPVLFRSLLTTRPKVATDCDLMRDPGPESRPGDTSPGRPMWRASLQTDHRMSQN